MQKEINLSECRESKVEKWIRVTGKGKGVCSQEEGAHENEVVENDTEMTDTIHIEPIPSCRNNSRINIHTAYHLSV